ncbi:hypothetical protein M8J77_014368 [Diaphorina citri]|nr:hypothetical protein M8J77_014368 [Diaphorina citri]
MGNKLVVFTEEQLEDYQDCTFFTRKEILRAQKRFREVSPSTVPKQMTGVEPTTVRVPVHKLITIAELRENPFGQRICQVFSEDGQGNLNFEEFLELLSVFSEQASRDIKVFYAFKIYDFDNDQYIGMSDLEIGIRLLTRSELSVQELTQVSEKVIEEADVDGDGKLSFMEFEHVILRAPDFLATFHIRI